VIGLNPLKSWIKHPLVSTDRDEELVGTTSMDTAGTAAYAFASPKGGEVTVYDYDNLLFFWEWWLRDAIPLAWEKIQLYP
jgi:hypothetical protein